MDSVILHEMLRGRKWLPSDSKIMRKWPLSDSKFITLVQINEKVLSTRLHNYVEVIWYDQELKQNNCFAFIFLQFSFPAI